MNRRNALKLHELIDQYYQQDYSRLAIIGILRRRHNIIISLRTLTRIQSQYNLRRKNLTESSLDEIILALSIELAGSDSLLGYKMMWKRLRNVYELTVKQQTVMYLLQILDPDGVEARSRYRLKHRQYDTPGPDFLWHGDNHDKLKRYGFAIYAIIDGFSKEVIGILVASTNNKPEVIFYLFAKTAIELDRIPTILRVDRGTEPGIMGCQKHLNVEQLEDLFLEYADVPHLCSTEFKEAVEAAIPNIQTPKITEDAYELFLKITDVIRG
ncbi:hypothetical protein QAD02_007556 [Eretmocerus hayati]|uniref:Uncharacterized protein n=1 Tax=Eretmocerus hayati TaxID=131215 RepID=A0ACC2N4A4_9HYME|nr:hypothetical protein QAD02_007556 [Eretmocerus hayati]